MTGTSIYFVETDARDQRICLCRWVERFYAERKRVRIVADSTMAAQHLDSMLWSFSDLSFIPHRILGDEEDILPIEPVVITVGAGRMEGFDVVVCDGAMELDLMADYPVAVHFVLRDDPERKQASRLLWQRAKEQGFRAHHVPCASDPSMPGSGR
jgi:DNA polymerase-3 subunit chi